MGTQRKIYALSKREDFEKLRKQGRKLRQDFLFIIYRKNYLPYSRIAWAFSRLAGPAVLRNRFKRQARGCLRKTPCPSGLDILIGFEKREKFFYKTINYEIFSHNLKTALKRIF